MNEKKLVSEIFSYRDLVDYQEGSVVSRTIIKKGAGTVTVFAFDEGEKLSTHSAPYDALLQVVDGTAEIKINDEEFLVEAPAVIIMPANEPHSVYAREKFKMVLVMIKEK
ncbi:MAG: cupin domain-containing protein [Elusimicrobia bacterium]|jgi:quercetin dioxygenase-like cupin family protein|nr:cupin domain-containing protein [Elusimicrobiota bacterium]